MSKLEITDPGWIPDIGERYMVHAAVTNPRTGNSVKVPTVVEIVSISIARGVYTMVTPNGSHCTAMFHREAKQAFIRRYEPQEAIDG